MYTHGIAHCDWQDEFESLENGIKISSVVIDFGEMGTAGGVGGSLGGS